MQQENISAKNIAKLREYAESSDDEIRRCATTALRIANIAPRKKHRIASLLRRDPDLIVEAAVDDLLAYEPTNGPTLGQLVAAVKAAPMRHFRRPWCLAGGWALEIWDDFIARRHSDIDIAVLREDQFELRQHLSRWQFQKSVRGTLLPWEEGERLELPIHEIHATPPGSDRSGIEFLLNERDGDLWRFRRDPRIFLPIEDFIVVQGDSWLPVLNPAIVLLYKAARPTPTDEDDMLRCHHFMTSEQRSWLRQALRVAYPNHPWIEVLETALETPETSLSDFPLDDEDEWLLF